MHYYVQYQEIDANQLKEYLENPGFFGSCYCKYVFHALTLFDNIYFC